MRFPSKLTGALWLNPRVACETGQGFSQRDCWARDKCSYSISQALLLVPWVSPCPGSPQSPFAAPRALHGSAPAANTKQHLCTKSCFTRNPWISTHLAKSLQQLQRKSQADASALPESEVPTAPCLAPSPAQTILFPVGLHRACRCAPKKRGHPKGEGAGDIMSGLPPPCMCSCSCTAQSIAEKRKHFSAGAENGKEEGMGREKKGGGRSPTTQKPRAASVKEFEL